MAAVTTVNSANRRRMTSLLGKPWSGVAVLLVFYIALIIVFSVLSPFFLSVRNMLSIGQNIAFVGLMAAAGTPLIIAGGLDLSVAAIAGLTGVAISILQGAGLDIWVAVALSLVIAAGVGIVNGLFTTRLRLNPLIVTLGMMSIVSGLSLVLTGGLTRPMMFPTFNWVGQGRVGGIPIPLVIMAVTFVALWVVLTRTRFGRFVYASGGNAEAARLIGIPVDRTIIVLYVISALSGAVAGIILCAMLGAAAPTSAGQYLLTVIAAIILGGTSLNGGRGSVWGTLLAILILGTLNNGLTLLNVSSFWQDVTRGVVLMLAVSLDQIRTRALGD
ncbi:ribose transport system permease protein [Kaistia hirudinis]|uniref:Ribose transport system permease protein n=1 Tax=Kaistia hirudinis TaxID=1293440 RepID=A0A840AUK7_9HYPH|nr:ABC transporter permease [Kaistia hirudinis]MBB3932135.1 ribose transport system permease protein [Kaistia hirudinis]MBN9016769.1 ABC transporter permease [Hyphomicrobiales bacterium]